MRSTVSTVIESLDDVIAWLETQDPTDTYNPGEPESCILCQILDSHGVYKPYVTYYDYSSNDDIFVFPYKEQFETLQRQWINRSKRLPRQAGQRPTYSLSIGEALVIAREVQQNPDDDYDYS